MIENTTIMTVDEPNKNGHIYPRAEMEKAIAKAPAGLLGYIGMEQQSLEKVSHIIENLKLNDDGTVTCNIKPLKTPAGMIVEQVGHKPDWCFRTAGRGTINDKNEVVDYTIISVNMVPTEEAA